MGSQTSRSFRSHASRQLVVSLMAENRAQLIYLIHHTQEDQEERQDDDFSDTAEVRYLSVPYYTSLASGLHCL